MTNLASIVSYLFDVATLPYQLFIKPNIRFTLHQTQHKVSSETNPIVYIPLVTKIITTQNKTILQSLFITFTGSFLIFLFVVIIILNFSLLLQEILLLLSNTGHALLEGHLLAVEPGKETSKF